MGTEGLSHSAPILTLLSYSNKYECFDEENVRVCLWHRNAQWGSPEEIKPELEAYSYPFLIPNLLVYSRIYDDIEGLENLRQLQASDQTPEGFGCKIIISEDIGTQAVREFIQEFY